MSRTSTIPRVEPTDCSQCLAFHREASAKLRERDVALEQAFDAAQVAEIEQEFDRSYIAIFRAWMDHKSTHETGSIRKYLEQIKKIEART